MIMLCYMVKVTVCHFQEYVSSLCLDKRLALKTLPNGLEEVGGADGILGTEGNI